MCTFYVDNRNVIEDSIMEQFWTIMPVTHEDRSGMTESYLPPNVKSSTSDHIAAKLIHTNKTNGWNLTFNIKPLATRE